MCILSEMRERRQEILEAAQCYRQNEKTNGAFAEWYVISGLQEQDKPLLWTRVGCFSHLLRYASTLLPLTTWGAAINYCASMQNYAEMSDSKDFAVFAIG